MAQLIPATEAAIDRLRLGSGPYLWHAVRRIIRKATEHRWAATIGLMLATAILASAQPVTTDADIIRMVKAKTPDAEIIELIQSTQPSYKFTDLAALEKAGVSDEVFKAMAARAKGIPPSNASVSVKPVEKESAGSSVRASDKKLRRQLTNEEMQTAYNVSVNHLSKTLKAPSTAQYASIEQSSITPARWGKMIVVRIDVDSQNSFGAMLRTNFVCRVGERRPDGLYFCMCSTR